MPKEISKAELLVMAVILSVLLLIWSAPFFGYEFKGVVGNSMEPVISEEDIVIIDTNYQEFRQGDIICFRYQINGEEYLFTHRIVEINDKWIQTKGDNMPEPDPYLVKRADIVGKEILTLPKLGILIRAAHTGYGFLLLIVIPAVLLIWLEVKKFFSP